LTYNHISPHLRLCFLIIPCPPSLQKTCFTKQIYLRAAHSILTNDQERRSYDTNLRQHGTAPLVPVSIQDLPGVVALLRACGNPASSYSVARATLSDPSLTSQLSQQDCADLALAGRDNHRSAGQAVILLYPVVVVITS
jgi:hypothetical protein